MPSQPQPSSDYHCPSCRIGFMIAPGSGERLRCPDCRAPFWAQCHEGPPRAVTVGMVRRPKIDVEA